MERKEKAEGRRRKAESRRQKAERGSRADRSLSTIHLPLSAAHGPLYFGRADVNGVAVDPAAQAAFELDVHFDAVNAIFADGDGVGAVGLIVPAADLGALAQEAQAA